MPVGDRAQETGQPPQPPLLSGVSATRAPGFMQILCKGWLQLHSPGRGSLHWGGGGLAQ